MKNPSQKQRIVKRLLSVGEIGRNECLRNYVSRLGAIICDLTKEGWSFDTERRGGDYVYKVVRSPFKEVTYKLSDGREVTTTEKL